MPHPSRSAGSPPLGPRSAVAVVLATVLVAAGVLAAPLVVRAMPSALRHLHHGATGPISPIAEPTGTTPGAGSPTAAATGSDDGARPLGDDDGYIPAGTSISPTADVPAITRLDPALRTAVQQAASDAGRAGVSMTVTSGWRSTRYQQHLLDAAVVRYGSLTEARRWVASPQTSEHVSGAAVDIASVDADRWLERHGTRYGLCRVYANEIWHFELLVRPGGTCPALRADATEG
jgi:zinc D-Ala-D-Ala carboxypeptidase